MYDPVRRENVPDRPERAETRVCVCVCSACYIRDPTSLLQQFTPTDPQDTDALTWCTRSVHDYTSLVLITRSAHPFLYTLLLRVSSLIIRLIIRLLVHLYLLVKLLACAFI